VGKVILKDATVIVDGHDLSNRASSVTMDLPDDEVDVSTFQGGDFKEFDKGLSDATFTVTFHVDFDAGQVDDVLWPLKRSGDAFTVQIRPFEGNASTTNREYRMTAKLYNYAPIAAAIGEALTSDVSFRNASSDGVTRHPS